MGLKVKVAVVVMVVWVVGLYDSGGGMGDSAGAVSEWWWRCGSGGSAPQHQIALCLTVVRHYATPLCP